ncbi:retinol dehydrogenase 12-like [Sabethes cyaneus]|uniref:retinol dehydrogenase 12-like n=1 Tax=Sabethes cyaneus TaxID=53552 RepID=UPI00237EA5DD|nr:retinol dehydrogenase 12-like [Sabethes cyaneus]
MMCAVTIIVGSIIENLFHTHSARAYMEGGQFQKATTCEGKVILITGANTGIGKETAKELLRRGGKIYIACRSLHRASEAKRELIEETGQTNIHVRYMDLSSLESVRTFARTFLEEEPRLDILINNAGVMATPRTLTREGYEVQFGVNHLGHFLLTNLLLDRLKASAPSRIVTVTSKCHKHGEINRNDLHGRHEYNPFAAYSNSKLANLLFSNELAKRLEGTGVTTYAVHPGSVYTDLQRHYEIVCPLLDTVLADWIMLLCFKSARAGAQTTIYAALDDELAGKTGKYYVDCQEKLPHELGLDEDTARWLWMESEKLTGITTRPSS